MSEIRSIVAIVVTWNGGAEAAAAVASLVEQDAGRTPSGHARELRVVAADNHSADDTAALAAQAGARVLALPANLGYGAAVNRAITAFAADAYVVCNQDAVYQPGFIAALADALDADAGVGAATAQVRLRGRFVRGEGGVGERTLRAHDGTPWRDARPGEDGVELLNSTGNEVTRSGNGRDRGWLAPVGTPFAAAVFGIHGGAAILRAAAVAPLGGFDERYFMYYEDTDLSARLRRAGWRIRYVPEAVSVHAHAGSSGTASPQFVRWNRRGRLRFALRHGPAAMKVRALVRTAGAAARDALPLLRARGTVARGTVARGVVARGVVARVPRFSRGAEVLPSALGENLGSQDAGAQDAGAQGAAAQDAGAQGAAPTVLVDCTALPEQLGGVGRYVEGLATGLAEIGAPHILLVKPVHAAHLRALVPGARILLAPAATHRTLVRLLWEQCGLPRAVRRAGATVLHSPHYTFPLIVRGFRRVVTVHDATFFTDPAAHSRLKRAFFCTWLRLAMRANVRLVAPSRATADEVAAHAGRPRHPITVAHHGVDRGGFHEPTAAEVTAFRRTHGVERWLAFLGTIEPRKRVGELVRAVRTLPDAPPLLLAGARGWDTDAAAELDRAAAELAAEQDAASTQAPMSQAMPEQDATPSSRSAEQDAVLASAPGVQHTASARMPGPPPATTPGLQDVVPVPVPARRSGPRILELGYLPREELHVLLGGADAVVYPSVNEGFGLPVLEAMACGAPVLTTRRSALPEVAGDAAAYCEPEAASIAAVLQDLLDNPAERQRMRTLGLERAAQFTWAAAARAHLAAYAAARASQ